MNRKKMIVLSIILIIITALILYILFLPSEKKISVVATEQTYLNDFFDTINKSKTSGGSIVIVDGNSSQNIFFNTKSDKNVLPHSEDALYEIGSMSKSFTALGLYLLIEDGKISLDDPIKDYIPELTFYYDNTETPVLVKHFLYHTSGLPFKSINNIKPSIDDDALEKTVMSLAGYDLEYSPGTYFEYATINYDVLGYLIEILSGQSYEEYMTSEVFIPLGLHNTYVLDYGMENADEIADGHKYTFYNPRKYLAPEYKGNAPAGYIYSNLKDMERWIKIQLGLATDVPDIFSKIIKETTKPDMSVDPSYGYYYAAGWDVHTDGNYRKHEGNNPNYSSAIIISEDSSFGVCVLTDLNSNAPSFLAMNIFNKHLQKPEYSFVRSIYQSSDIVFSTVLIIFSIISIIYLFLIIKTIIETGKKQRLFDKNNFSVLQNILFPLLILCLLGFGLYKLPDILFGQLSWAQIKVWTSPTVILGFISFFVGIVLIVIYTELIFNLLKKSEKGYFSLVPLSIINGISSILIIMTINESFNNNLKYSKDFLLYFMISLLFFLYTLQAMNSHLIVIANEAIYEKRMTLIDKILKTSYESIEKIGPEKIHTGLTTDCSEISKLPGIVVNFISDILTLLFCLVYLFFSNKWVFAVSFLIIVLNALMSVITSKLAEKHLVKARLLQDKFYKQISEMLIGFKELFLNKFRIKDFHKDISNTAGEFSEESTTSSIKFLNYNLYNTFMYNIVFGVVAFGFPIFIKSINTDQLRESLLIVFYMIAPFNSLAYYVPQLANILVSTSKIKELETELDQETLEDNNNHDLTNKQIESLYFENLSFSYTNSEGDAEFHLSDIFLKLKAGQITFLVGGNGSGKSTLAKIVAGLYTPESGNIYINDNISTPENLTEISSAIFTDFHIFDKLYGYDTQKNQANLKDYLEKLLISEKIKLTEDNEINKNNLSTGQKKRLAYAICRLEDKPLIILDEWAAEQDVEFREYFYKELLQELKSENKIILVVTHDDRFFDYSDQILKMEHGKIVSQ